MRLRLMLSALGIALSAAACTTPQSPTRVSFNEPGESDIRTLFAAELHADPWFVESNPTATHEARRITTMFRTELVDVRKQRCTKSAGRAGHVCIFEVALRFPNMQDRESRSVWERRFYRDGDGWVMSRNID